MAKNDIGYKKLPFDSKLFGYKVALLDSDLKLMKIPKILDKLRHDGVKLAYWFINPTNKKARRVAAEYSGILVDEKVTYSIHVNSIKLYLNESEKVKTYKRKTVSRELLSLALQSGKFSRFYADDHFKRREYKILYTAWIRKSVQHTLAFEVLVYAGQGGKIKGMVTLENNDSIGNIGLFAVDNKYRRQSVGTALMMGALNSYKNKEIEVIHVKTQSKNIAACRFYEKIGFGIIKRDLIYHFWL